MTDTQNNASEVDAKELEDKAKLIFCSTTNSRSNLFYRLPISASEYKGLSPRFYIMGDGANVVRQSKEQDKSRLEEHLRRGGTVIGEGHGQLGSVNQRSSETTGASH